MSDWERSLNLFKSNRLRNSQFIFMGRPSLELRNGGLSKKRIGISVGKLRKVMREHSEVNFQILEKLDVEVNNPKYLLQSSTDVDSIVVIPIILNDGRVFIVPIRKDFVTSTGETINMITSVYLKEDKDWLSREDNKGMIIFRKVDGAA